MRQVNIIRNLDPQTNFYLLQNLLSELSYETDFPRDQDRRDTTLGILKMLNLDSIKDKGIEVYKIYTQTLLKLRNNLPEIPYGSIESMILAGNHLAALFPPGEANHLEFNWYLIADYFEDQDDRAFITDESSKMIETMEENTNSAEEEHPINDNIKTLYQQEPARAYRILRENYGMNNFAEIGRLLGKTRKRVSYEIGIYNYTPRRPLRK